MKDMLQVGAITSTHGLQGEVKVFPTTDDPKRFRKLKQVLIKQGSGMKELEITQVKFFKNLVILKFKDHDRIEDVMGYKGMELYVTRENAVKLGKDEYFVADLIGMAVVLEDESVLGTLADVLETGANDVYVINTHDGREVLIPAIRQCVLNVDVEENCMKVHLLDGMME